MRAAELSSVGQLPPLGVPFKHIISLVQITQGDVSQIQHILKRNGYASPDVDTLKSRITYAQNWLASFAPEEMKFEIQTEMPGHVSTLGDMQKKGLALLADRLKPEMDAAQTHEILYGLKEELGLSPKNIFEAVYISILGKTKGPRAGFFLASLDHDFVKKRFRQTSQETSEG